ncbi:predicted protein [Aspergillus terreus NIH2624]|uniref:Uncharacterized protein n=1 Tax=Aspergillus terreus (strain NIH 2624 / FGSC A1156) TaxID=341663 RepID=Q0CRE5_ASPTN|nr:uncharacterized protein ATEG_03739 [Aspergillus terreus NIH2624]EAU35541.1 predicted protein [Aspergillus terreus NIH2624]
MAAIKPNKKSYTDLSTVLILLSTFAGAVTLQTQFALPESCNGSRVRTLMAFASQFFLMCPISVFSIFVALHNRDDGVIIETGKHEFLQFQFAVTGFMIVVGFLLLNVAVQYAGGYYVGSAGLALTATFVLMAVSCSIEDHLPPPAGANAAQNLQQGQRQDEPQLSLSQFLGLRKSSLLIPKGRLVLRWVIVGLVVLEVTLCVRVHMRSAGQMVVSM